MMSEVVVKTVEQMQAYRHSLSGKVAFVPTMGALHEGHLSLVKLAKQHADTVIMSIFVNPTQFGPQEDFLQYPRDVAGDIQKCRSVGVDCFFTPGVEDIYPPGFGTYVVPEAPFVKLWEGERRPGHFRGVATVVLRLFNLVRPHMAVFGLKDYQQCLVIQKMAQDFHLPLQIVAAPTHREAGGLSMSSRNQYLSPVERQQALGIYQALLQAQRALLQAGQTHLPPLLEALKPTIETGTNVQIDYLAFVHPDTLEPQTTFTEKTLLLAAVKVGQTRLIDNLLITQPPLL